MLILDKDNFGPEVLEAEGYVLVDFWSSKCEPCLALMPSIEESAQNHPQVKFAKLNILENRRLAIGQRVMGLPTIIVYKGGEKVAELSKDFQADDVETKLRELGV